MSSVMMMSRVFLAPNTQETRSSPLQAPNLRNYLLKVAHNPSRLAGKALSKATLPLSRTTILTHKISTTGPHTTQATVFLSRSSSIQPCSSLALLLRALHPLQEASKAPARYNLSQTIMVEGSMVNNTSFQPRPMMISDISTMHHSTIMLQQ